MFLSRFPLPVLKRVLVPACLWACFPALLPAEPSLRVALYDDGGSAGPGVPKMREHLGGMPECAVTLVTAAQIREGVLADHDVLVVTGGSGRKQADTLGERGRTEVREFVAAGGGYVGICAGAYLACEGFPWGLRILDAKTVSPKWKRGRADVRVELTGEGRRILGPVPAEFEVRYANGPIIQPAGSDEIPDFRSWALFRSEVAENDSPPGVMIDSPALAAGMFGLGRVLVSSPHPEQTTGLEDLVKQAVRWAGGGTPD